MISKKTAQNFAYIFVGTFLMSIATNVFYSPSQLVTGGLQGVAIILEMLSKEYFNISIPIWATVLTLNLPLFVIAVKVLGKSFIIKTITGTLLLSLWLYLTQAIPPMTSDLTLASIYGGVISGIGLGLVFRTGFTTGGTDIAANILHKYFKHIHVSQFLFFSDFVIIATGFIIFGGEKALYSVIAVFISSKVIQALLEGLSFAKAAFIISDQSELIARMLLEKINRGATGLNGKGMYTGHSKNVLLSVVSSKEVILLKELVRSVDEKAFVIVADVREVMGEGFINNIS